jgi:hypothetical protein
LRHDERLVSLSFSVAERHDERLVFPSFNVVEKHAELVAGHRSVVDVRPKK